ncbi:MAG: sigma 54-interacting transcriptional regulator [Syntrophobacteraceae bacterium]|nr:sigma 54-interacting transcriptional regulator [Syntrophobacteraceae bacterium]
MAFRSPPQIAGLFDNPVSLPMLLDEIPLGVAVIDKGRRIQLLNRGLEALTGYTRQEAQGIGCEFILRSNVCLEDCPLRQAKPIADPVSVEGNIVNRDRQKIPVRLTFSPIRDHHGKLVGYLETVQDIRLLRTLGSRTEQTYGFGQIIGRCPEMERIYQILPVIAQSDSSVLITGETGSGKDFVAEAIHQASPRAKGPFIKVNCGALPETLLESELFGHQKGAFTGAVENKPGRFRLAHNGTLYLTEIGDLPLALQVKLLTFLDDRVVYPLGSTRGFQVNVRVIAATHRDLERMVREGRFREDLLFRLNVVRLRLPALRERGDDIRLLLDHFLQTFAGKLKRPIKGFSARALKVLLAYPFPGNVRELKNTVEYALTICQEDHIHTKHLPAYLLDPRPDFEKDPGEAPRQAAESAPVLAGEDTSVLDWSTVERRMILEAMVKAKGRRSRAAALLGWGRSTLWRKLKQYGIEE